MIGVVALVVLLTKEAALHDDFTPLDTHCWAYTQCTGNTKNQVCHVNRLKRGLARNALPLVVLKVIQHQIIVWTRRPERLHCTMNSLHDEFMLIDPD